MMTSFIIQTEEPELEDSGESKFIKKYKQVPTTTSKDYARSTTQQPSAATVSISTPIPTSVRRMPTSSSGEDSSSGMSHSETSRNTNQKSFRSSSTVIRARKLTQSFNGTMPRASVSAIEDIPDSPAHNPSLKSKKRQTIADLTEPAKHSIESASLLDMIEQFHFPSKELDPNALFDDLMEHYGRDGESLYPSISIPTIIHRPNEKMPPPHHFVANDNNNIDKEKSLLAVTAYNNTSIGEEKEAIHSKVVPSNYGKSGITPSTANPSRSLSVQAAIEALSNPVLLPVIKRAEKSGDNEIYSQREICSLIEHKYDQDIDRIIFTSMNKAQVNAEREVRNYLDRRESGGFMIEISNGDKMMSQADVSEAIKTSMERVRESAHQEIASLVKKSIRLAREYAREEIRAIVEESIHRARESTKLEMQELVKDSIHKPLSAEESVASATHACATPMNTLGSSPASSNILEAQQSLITNEITGELLVKNLKIHNLLFMEETTDGDVRVDDVNSSQQFVYGRTNEDISRRIVKDGPTARSNRKEHIIFATHRNVLEPDEEGFEIESSKSSLSGKKESFEKATLQHNELLYASRLDSAKADDYVLDVVVRIADDPLIESDIEIFDHEVADTDDEVAEKVKEAAASISERLRGYDKQKKKRIEKATTATLSGSERQRKQEHQKPDYQESKNGSKFEREEMEHDCREFDRSSASERSSNRMYTGKQSFSNSRSRETEARDCASDLIIHHELLPPLNPIGLLSNGELVSQKTLNSKMALPRVDTEHQSYRLQRTQSIDFVSVPGNKFCQHFLQFLVEGGAGDESVVSSSSNEASRLSLLNPIVMFNKGSSCIDSLAAGMSSVLEGNDSTDIDSEGDTSFDEYDMSSYSQTDIEDEFIMNQDDHSYNAGLWSE